MLLAIVKKRRANRKLAAKKGGAAPSVVTREATATGKGLVKFHVVADHSAKSHKAQAAG